MPRRWSARNARSSRSQSVTGGHACSASRLAATSAAITSRSQPGSTTSPTPRLQDPHVWAAAVDEVLLGLRAKFKEHRVLALAIDGTSGTILPIDDDGAPIGLASMYNDVTDEKFLALVMKVAPEDTAARGGSSPLARALEMQDKTGTARILHQADWIAGRFSGRFDVSDEHQVDAFALAKCGLYLLDPSAGTKEDRRALATTTDAPDDEGCKRLKLKIEIIEPRGSDAKQDSTRRYRAGKVRQRRATPAPAAAEARQVAGRDRPSRRLVRHGNHRSALQ